MKRNNTNPATIAVIAAVVITAIVGLLVGQLLVAITHWNNKEYLGVLLVMLIGMVIGTGWKITGGLRLKQESNPPMSFAATRKSHQFDGR